ncbi:MAG: twin-arginine translocase TatA/TatE family subunit [Kiritimatiellae bacterium]|nr:twin-arginine translocase TatA/TatE family subunit [Kiritimatiellia bacterium]
MTFAFIFESVGGTEWLVLLGVVLIVVGPKNLPAAARKMGQIMSTLRRAADEFKRQVMSMDQEVSKAVNDATSDTSSSADSSSSGEADASSGSDNGEDLYGDDNPYPGYEDYYDETQYQDGSAPDSDGGGEDRAVAEAAQGDAPAADSAKHVPTDAELKAVKITVTTNDSAKKGAVA